MAKRSPPIPFETGSINPSVALAAIAASTALPPRFRTSSPTCVASGTLVQTTPWRAMTSERVAKGLPVIRSTCASSGETVTKKNNGRKARRLMQQLSISPSAIQAFQPSLVTQRCDGIEPSGAIGREEGKDAANQKCPDAHNCDIARDYFGGDFRKLVNLFREDFYLRRAGQPAAELISVANQCHAQTESAQRPKQSYDDALTEKDADDLRDISANRFHDADVARLLHGNRDERVHDPKGRYDDDKEEEEKHHGSLQAHGLEKLAVHIDPGLRVLRRLKKLLDVALHP